MPTPVIQGSGFTLKTTGQSTFWIVANDLSARNVVNIASQDSSKTWSGSVVTVVRERALVRVSLDRGCESKEEEGDLETVDVTVTNGDGTSTAHEDEAVIDGPGT